MAGLGISGNLGNYRFDTIEGHFRLTDINLPDGEDGTIELRSYDTLDFADQTISLDPVVTQAKAFAVNTSTLGKQLHPSVAYTDASFNVVWVGIAAGAILRLQRVSESGQKFRTGFSFASLGRAIEPDIVNPCRW
jgi:hypothetical protein